MVSPEKLSAFPQRDSEQALVKVLKGSAPAAGDLGAFRISDEELKRRQALQRHEVAALASEMQ